MVVSSNEEGKNSVFCQWEFQWNDIMWMINEILHKGEGKEMSREIAYHWKSNHL